ncbi:hypothetical protein E4U17_005384 [Claviceps sp. LM77 group G4]|nr:hypothetical protein E4U17_005384 [Claviceps sp. LM77 group G4]KAG6082382.1 hypothetical protein E4U33_005812 [Claviceps sp. LM78 group G4]KAG6082749.1 hypothetical protein E4U16_005610 [Claviceps sp. LM84 group G4]
MSDLKQILFKPCCALLPKEEEPAPLLSRSLSLPLKKPPLLLKKPACASQERKPPLLPRNSRLTLEKPASTPREDFSILRKAPFPKTSPPQQEAPFRLGIFSYAFGLGALPPPSFTISPPRAPPPPLLLLLSPCPQAAAAADDDALFAPSSPSVDSASASDDDDDDDPDDESSSLLDSSTALGLWYIQQTSTRSASHLILILCVKEV